MTDKCTLISSVYPYSMCPVVTHSASITKPRVENSVCLVETWRFSIQLLKHTQLIHCGSSLQSPERPPTDLKAAALRDTALHYNTLDCFNIGRTKAYCGSHHTNTSVEEHAGLLAMATTENNPHQLSVFLLTNKESLVCQSN